MTQKISVAVKEEKIDDTLMPEVHVSEASMELQNHVVILFSVIISLCSYYIEKVINKDEKRTDKDRMTEIE